MDESILSEEHLEPLEQEPNAGGSHPDKYFPVKWKLLGEPKGDSSVAGRPVVYAEGLHYLAPSSVAYFCPQCKQIWATVEVEVECQDWLLELRACPHHGAGYMLYYEIPEDEVWRRFDYSALDNPPDELMLRELELIGTRLDIERYPGGYQQQIEMGV